MSNEARHRDIAALLARGVIRVKKQPFVAKAIESHMPDGKTYPADQQSQAERLRANDESHEQIESMTPIQVGGEQ